MDLQASTEPNDLYSKNKAHFLNNALSHASPYLETPNSTIQTPDFFVSATQNS
jgi:hypothetical protein